MQPNGARSLGRIAPTPVAWAAFLALALLPSALADSTFHFTSDALTLDDPGAVAPLPFNMRPELGPDGGTILQWDYTFLADGMFVPTSTHFVLNATDDTVIPPSREGGVNGVLYVNACAFYLDIQLPDYHYYFCGNQYESSVLSTGLHPLDFDWGTDLEAQPVQAGDTLSVFLTTGATSRSGHDTLTLDVADAGDLATLEVAGTNEPVPATGNTTDNTTTSSTTSAAPSGSSASGPSTSHTVAPGKGTTAPGPVATGTSSPAEASSDEPTKESPALPAMLVGGVLLIALTRRRLT